VMSHCNFALLIQKNPTSQRQKVGNRKHNSDNKKRKKTFSKNKNN